MKKTNKLDRQLRLRKLLERQLDASDLEQVNGGGQTTHTGGRASDQRGETRYCLI